MDFWTNLLNNTPQILLSLATLLSVIANWMKSQHIAEKVETLETHTNGIVNHLAAAKQAEGFAQGVSSEKEKQLPSNPHLGG